MRRIADLYLSSSVQAEVDHPGVAAGKTFEEPSLFQGKYLDPRRHTVFSFSLAKGELVGWGMPLRRTGVNRFDDLGTGTITFDRVGDNMTSSLTMDGEEVFRGERVTAVHLSDAELAALSGTYSSSELGERYQLSRKEDHLILQRGAHLPVVLAAMTASDFEAGDLGTIVFERGPDQTISGFSVFTENVRGLVFKRQP